MASTIDTIVNALSGLSETVRALSEVRDKLRTEEDREAELLAQLTATRERKEALVAESGRLLQTLPPALVQALVAEEPQEPEHRAPAPAQVGEEPKADHDHDHDHDHEDVDPSDYFHDPQRGLRPHNGEDQRCWRCRSHHPVHTFSKNLNGNYTQPCVDCANKLPPASAFQPTGTTRQCPACKTQQPCDDFEKNGHDDKGRQKYRGLCKACKTCR